ncbi:MAG: outer membrane beta-barrel protein [Nitrospinae bacterium]|nr:outer membrane beta-barrel protein [Nitrospinota bacterium]
MQRGAGDVFGFYFEYEGEDEHFLGLNEPLGDTLNGFNHDISGGVNFGGPGGRGDITIGGRYDKSNNLRGGSGGSASQIDDGDELSVADSGKGDLSSNIGSRVDNETIEGYLDIIYSPSRIFKLKFGADVEAEEFGGTSSSQNVDTYNIGGSFFWQATPLVAYGVKYNHRIIDFEKSSSTNDNSNSDQIYLALNWKISKLISSEFAVGFDTKRFDKLSGEDREDLVFQIYVKYRPTERTRLSMRAHREIIDSSFGTIQSYVRTSLRLQLVQKLGKRFRANVMSRFQNRDYQRSVVDTKGGGVVRTRVDNTFRGSVAVIYEIQKWLEAKAKYEYRQTFSNFDDKDYRSNVGILEISAKY